jgi:Holliday junction resolvase
MTINSKSKGARFEREIAAKYRAAGFNDAHRTAQYCGKTGQAADVEGVPGIHIECKHQERLQIYDWIDQAKRDAAGTGDIPAVHFRRNNCEVLVCIRFDDFVRLIIDGGATNE